MQTNNTQSPDIRIEIVTAAFVAAGVPEGIHDLGRLLENLNNPAITKHLSLTQATLRPLYRAASPLVLDAPLLVRRDEIVFATFEGPNIAHDVVKPSLASTPCLMMAPPFQIQGDVALLPGADRTQALRSLVGGFFQASDARVYDAEGYLLGEGQQIVVNGAVVQMVSPTRRHIETFVEKAGHIRRAASAHATGEEVEPMVEREQVARAA
jgi:hypothetical protein